MIRVKPRNQSQAYLKVATRVLFVKPSRFARFCFSFDIPYFDFVNPVHLSCTDEKN